MKLFQKRWFAVVVAVLLIAAAIGISRARLGGGDYTPESASTAQKWGEEHADAYTGFVDDSARLFSAQTLEAIAAENGALDYRYGTILGLATVGSTADIEEAAYDASADLGLGEGDFLLLLDAGARTGTWSTARTSPIISTMSWRSCSGAPWAICSPRPTGPFGVSMRIWPTGVRTICL